MLTFTLKFLYCTLSTILRLFKLKMNKQNKFKTEYANSNFSLCKECKKNIKKKSVKIGKVFQVKNLINID